MQGSEGISSLVGMKVIRHAGVDSRMIILDNHLLECLIVQNNHPTIIIGYVRNTDWR